MNQLERDIYDITSNKQIWILREFSISWIKYESWCETIAIEVLRKAIEQHIVHFGYQKRHPVSHILKSIWRMGSGDNVTTHSSKWLNITNMGEAYQSGNKVNYIRHMLKNNDLCTSLDYLEETLSYLALQGWYHIDTSKVFSLLSATNKRQSTHRVHLISLQTIEGGPSICPVSHEVYHLRETHVHGV
jgi:hypothetical protein